MKKTTILNLLKEGKNYAEIVFEFPEMKEIQKLIDPNDLAPNGFEDNPHVTLLYGFDDSVVPEDVQKILDKVKITSFKTDKISYFPDFGSGEPLKFDIVGPEIMHINKLLQALPHPSTTFEYRPHVTIAYLKKGQAEKYTKNPKLNNLTFDLKPKEVKYSKNKVKTNLKLNEQTLNNTKLMEDIFQNWNSYLNEQTEPYQRKMKAGHSRKKRRVIGHGGQKAGPPYTKKPSMERSKSAPPMGEGILDFFKRKKPEEEQPAIPTPYTDYNEIGNTGIYVGRFPMAKDSKENRVFQPDVLNFDKVYLVAGEEVEFLNVRQPNVLKENEGKIITGNFDDTATPKPEQLKEMESMAKNIAESKGKILVACSAGKNRSSAIAARAIALREGGVKSDQDLDNIVNMIRSARGPSALAYTHMHKTGATIDKNKPPQHDAFINFIKNGPTSTLEESLRRVIRRLIREQHGRKRYT